jgi:tRNA pseudouridine38-40 synthase
MKYLINLEYDGSKFHGYQTQKSKLTVEGEIEKNLSKIFNENINALASSRTDKGVHALDQYCHFESNKFINPKKLKYSLNTMLNKSIYIKSIKKVKDEFNSRYNVSKKEYIYKINMGIYNPLEKDYILQYNKNISKDLLNTFINKMNGKHNFKSFTSDQDKTNYIKELTIDYKISKKVLYLRFESKSFLRYMIRNIVGLLIEINNGKKKLEDIKIIFESENRTSLGKCAPPEGLYLNKVIFNDN